jgi:hypothetical protein
MWGLDVSQPYGPPWSVTGIYLPYPWFQCPILEQYSNINSTEGFGWGIALDGFLLNLALALCARCYRMNLCFYSYRINIYSKRRHTPNLWVFSKVVNCTESCKNETENQVICTILIWNSRHNNLYIHKNHVCAIFIIFATVYLCFH